MSLVEHPSGLMLPTRIERSMVPSGANVIGLQEVVDRYDFVEVADGYAIVTPKRLSDTTELGYSGMSNWGSYLREDYNPLMRGIQALQTYDKMRRSDGQVRKSLRIAKTPVLAGRWYMEPASDQKIDQTIADRLWKNLTQQMSISWPQFLYESLNFLDFGWYAWEIVYEFDTDGKLKWQKFAPRYPMDLIRWEYDVNGGVNAGWFYKDTGMGPLDEVRIPIEKLIVFTYDREAGDMQGISVLRSAYPHYYFKHNLYKIDAIQKERHGIGIPIIKLPPGFTTADKSAADELGRNLRTNEKSHVTLPPYWEILFAKLEGHPVDCLPSIEHHNQMILANVLAEFVGGSETDPSAQMEIFLKASRIIADMFCDAVNRWAVHRLVEKNWPARDAPELRYRRIGDTVDWRTLSFAVRNLVGAGVLTPDDKLEDFFRDEMDLSKVDKATARVQRTPQLPEGVPPSNITERITAGPGGVAAPVASPPRQSTAPGMQQQAQGTGKANAGQDNSGGK